MSVLYVKRARPASFAYAAAVCLPRLCAGFGAWPPCPCAPVRPIFPAGKIFRLRFAPGPACDGLPILFLPFSVSPGPVFLSTGLCRRVCAARVCMSQHKTPLTPARKISSVNRIHQSVSPGFGPAPLLHPASALVRCFAHCFCPIAMLFSLSYSLYNKSLWQSHGKRLPFRPTLISIFCSFCALIQSVSSPVFFPLLFAASAPPATAHYTHLSRPLCFSFAGRLSSQTFLPLQRFAPTSAAPSRAPFAVLFLLAAANRAYILIVLLRAFSVFTCALGRFFDTKKSAVCAL